MKTPRPKYPRPQFVREQWLNLNGIWQFTFDDKNIGLAEKWFQNPEFTQDIVVPFAFQAPLSGIGTNDFHDVVWYTRSFDLPDEWPNKHILLHFGAVDYRAQVWVNGNLVKQHEGGHVPFHVDISHVLQSESNQITVRVEDISSDLEQPRGKQYWERNSASIYYTRTTGIWQTVWLEPVPETYIESIRLVSDIDEKQVNLTCKVEGFTVDLHVEMHLSFNGTTITQQSYHLNTMRSELCLNINETALLYLWSPENPQLYDLTLRLRRGDELLDAIQSYVGMRKISVENGKIHLNNQPYYMRLVLDQGYHPEGLMTFPSDEAIKHDIELTKAMGFNGVRKHQKVEEPRYLYWADHLGLLVWGEMAATHAYSETAIQRITYEWQQTIARDFNHPSIVVWVPINESWGVPNLRDDPCQIDHLLTLYYLIRSLDQTRLVISNDGWEHANTDLLTIHDYEGDGKVLSERYATVEKILMARPANRDLYVQRFEYKGEPILVTEFGGIAYQKDTQSGWGYTVATDDEDFIRRYRDVATAILSSPVVQGFCYTQLMDVEQEINGLLTYDRQPKVDVAKLKFINLGQTLENPE